jgi:hypothetical protein
MSMSSMEKFFRNLARTKVPYWGHLYRWTGEVDSDFIGNVGECVYCGDRRWFYNLREFKDASFEQCSVRLHKSFRNYIRLRFRRESVKEFL